MQNEVEKYISIPLYQAWGVRLFKEAYVKSAAKNRSYSLGSLLEEDGL